MRLPHGTAVQGPFLWDNQSEYGMVGRYAWFNAVSTVHDGCLSMKGKGQEPRMRSEFKKLRDNRAPPRDRGTVDTFAGQSPKMWDVW